MATVFSTFPEDIEYPYCDGKPVAESDFQFKPLVYAVQALRAHFQDRPDVYVAGNMFVYYEEGNPKAVVAPNVFAVFGADKKDRFSYKVWKKPKAPDFVLEVTSRSTFSEDQGAKRGIYALLGVREYWQYDPTQDYLDPPLKGFQLIDRNYYPLAPTVCEAQRIILYSPLLDLELRWESGEFRFYNPKTQRLLMSYQELENAQQQAEQARQRAEQTALQEQQLRQAAEARLAELAARLQALQGSDSKT